MKANPQNPYESYTIEASAGAGKTYQLTRRFLNLVSAGAHPGGILTITFTVKAATEMKARIIQEASSLLYNKARQYEFDQAMRNFYQDYQAQCTHSIAAPRSAQQTAQLILSATQLLRITTIDALFYDWFAKFPWEANPFPSTMDMRSLPYQMMDGLQIEDLNKRAWEHLFANKSENALQHCLTLLDLDSDQGILGLEHKVFELFRHYTFLWQSEQETNNALVHYDLPRPMSEEDFFRENTEDLRLIISHLKSKDIFLEALRKRTLAALFASRFLNQDGEISGIFVRGKTREQLSQPILSVNQALGHYLSLEKLSALNSASTSLFAIYKLWLDERETLKRKDGLVEFHDLAIGNYKLFHDPAAIGATWLIHKSFQHLMIDECQDTSFLQWSVFRNLVEEILASRSDETAPNTVFLVGDQKQSIYGFREADPVVLEHMNGVLQNFEKTCIPLHKSYRSAPLILDYVNRVFHETWNGDFPTHATAQNEDGSWVVPDQGRIVVQDVGPLSMSKDEAVADEAKFVAQYLQAALSGQDPHPVYDKKTQSYRPLMASDCVILYRSTTHVEVFEAALREYGIAYLREERKGFYERTEIRDTLALLRFLNDTSDMVSLLTFLRSPMGRIEDRELLNVLDKTRGQKRRELALLDELKERSVWQPLRDLMLAYSNLSPSRLLFESYEIFSAHAAYGVQSLDGEIARKNLNKLYELLLNLENENHRNLDAVLEQIALHEQRNEEASASAEGQAVRLMTVHKAKGLEFPLVFLIKTSEPWYRVDRYWAKVNTWKRRGMALVGTQKHRPKQARQLQSIMETAEQNLADEAKRLLYVALTRASQYLVITAHPTSSLAGSFYPILREHAPTIDTNRQIVSMTCTSRKERYAHEAFIYTKSTRRLPDQLSIIHPHASERIRNVVGSSISLDTSFAKSARDNETTSPSFIQRFMGVVIHAALAQLSQRIAIDFPRIWESEVKKLPYYERTQLQESQHLLDVARNDVARVCNSREWQDLISDAKVIYPELRMVHFRKTILVVGCCDLYVEKNNGDIHLVEWKTMQIPADTDVQDFALANGFVQQLDQYVRTIKTMRPKSKVRACLWFTKTGVQVQR